MDDKNVIARRVAQELKPGQLVSLGVGLPTLVANYLPEDVEVFFHSENGFIGDDPLPDDVVTPDELTDAGGTLLGACAFDSAFSFGLIRGGHLDVSVLGGLQVDEQGQLANWMLPGQKNPGMGGVMDFVTSARRVIVGMTHTAKGKSKIVPCCTFPLTSLRRVDLIVTELAVIEPTEKGLVLREIAPGVDVETVQSLTTARLIVDESFT